MGLSDEERKSVIAFRLQKANETFVEIPVLLENKFYRTAANRLYYACYYAVSALLIKDGHETHTHSGVKTVKLNDKCSHAVIFRKISNNKIKIKQNELPLLKNMFY